MTSNQQIEANRMNAKRNTGPRQPQGKNERVAMLCVTAKRETSAGYLVPTLLGRSDALHPSTGKISRPADDVGHDEGNRLPNNFLHPDEKLRDAVDLIVIGAIRL